MLNDGFQYLEQRDTDNNITHEGVVGKYSAFATSDNKGIFDIVAEDLRSLYDDMSSLGLAKLKQDITNMYNEMKNDPNWGTTTAVAQAQAALDAAKRAEQALEQIKKETESAQSVIDELNSLDNTMRQLQEFVTETKTNADNAKSSKDSAKVSADSASSSADLSKSWAVDTGSPDNATDTDSPTGKTQSSRTWALYSKENANNAASVASTVQGIIDNAVAVLRQELVSQSNLILHAEDGFSPKVKRISFTDGTTYAVKKAVAMATQPTDGSSVWFRTSN